MYPINVYSLQQKHYSSAGKYQAIEAELQQGLKQV